jgi:hypothetical protein
VDTVNGPNLEITAFIDEQPLDFHFMLARQVEFIRRDAQVTPP